MHAVLLLLLPYAVTEVSTSSPAQGSPRDVVAKLEDLVSSMAHGQADLRNLANDDAADVVILEDQEVRRLSDTCKCSQYEGSATLYTDNCFKLILGRRVCHPQTGNPVYPCPSDFATCTAVITPHPTPLADPTVEHTTQTRV